MKLLVECKTKVYQDIKAWLLETDESEWSTTSLVKKILETYSPSNIESDMRILIACYSEAFQDIIDNSDLPTKVNEAKIRLRVVSSIINARTIQRLFAES